MAFKQFFPFVFFRPIYHLESRLKPEEEYMRAVIFILQVVQYRYWSSYCTTCARVTGGDIGGDGVVCMTVRIHITHVFMYTHWTYNSYIIVIASYTAD
jgi:hypothetical protein